MISGDNHRYKLRKVECSISKMCIVSSAIFYGLRLNVIRDVISIGKKKNMRYDEGKVAA